MNRQLILVRGVPGSGKSTYAMSLADQDGYIHLEADMFFEQDGEYKFDREMLAEAHSWCLSQTESYLRMGHDVVVSNTFVQHWEMKPYLKLAKASDIGIVECNGGFKSIHNVPLEIFDNMSYRFHDHHKLYSLLHNDGISDVKYIILDNKND